MKSLLPVLLTIACGALLLLAGLIGVMSNEGRISSPADLPACEFEDSSWCVWDARLRGNGTGQSFVATYDGGPIIYAELTR